MDEELLRELFVTLGPVSIRRLFGGQGIYADGSIVALVVRGALFLKTDPQTAPEFEAAGLVPWIYQRPQGPAVRMPYHSVPDDIFDDPDSAARWVALAREASRRAAAATRKSSLQAKRPR